MAATHFDVVAELLALGFPEVAAAERYRASGPGYHIVTVPVGAVDAAGIYAAFDDLTAASVARWGEPEIVDLIPYLWEDAPEPFGTLCEVSHQLRLWWVPGSGRWVGLGVGQADTQECPIEVLAAVGQAAPR